MVAGPAGAPLEPALRSSLERFLLAATCASVVAALLLAAGNGLVPTQRPLTFGLVFWGWILAVYGAVALVLGLAAGLAARFSGFERLSRLGPLATAAALVVVVLPVNRRGLRMLVQLDGPARFRWLAPAAVALAILGLALLATVSWRRRVLPRLCVLLAAAACGGALAPARSPRRAAPEKQAALAAQASKRPVAPPLLVVGVDGADWDMLGPLIARGELPHFADLKRRGAWGELQTLRPTLSPVIWTTIVTGKSPKDHGVRGFTVDRLRGIDDALPTLQPPKRLGFPLLFERLRRGRQMFKGPVTSAARKVPAVWDVASVHGSPTNVLNWWATWPADPLLGNMISERAYHWALDVRNAGRTDSRLTFPEALYADLVETMLRPEAISVDQTRAFMDVTDAEFEQVRRNPLAGSGVRPEFPYFYSMFQTYHRLALRLTERGRARHGASPDLLLLIRLVDQSCHTSLQFSELVDDHLGAGPDDLKRFGRVVSEAYRAVDRALGELLEAFGECNVIVVSDHGFELERFPDYFKYSHYEAPNGIFIGAGPAFRSAKLDGLSVYDVMPLMARLRGLPVADDLEGRLPMAALDEAYLEKHPARRLASYGTRERPEVAASSEDVDAEMLDRLRALGYIQ